jgi:diadenosine tetraphosphate (Ap4A) HIT family hydrolase
VAKKIAAASGVADFNILQNNGRIAHQMVDHVHGMFFGQLLRPLGLTLRIVHMIPKPNEKEGLGISWPQQDGDKEKLQKLLEELKAKM